LTETDGHARVVLSQVRKNIPTESELIDTTGKGKDGGKCTGKESEGNANHCPINDGQPTTTHIQQNNLEDNAYISDIYIGNPPQKIRALFDTGSTNTWVLNEKVVLPGGA